jgi:hypothetical protein
MEVEDAGPKPLRGTNKVSNYQRMIIGAVLKAGSRSIASKELGIPLATIDDALYRAFRALNVRNITDANYLLTQGITSRKPE